MTHDPTAGRSVISKTAVILLTYLNGDVKTVSEIAGGTGLPLSTVRRLVRQLTDWKILECTDGGDYRVGLLLRLIGESHSAPTTTPLPAGVGRAVGDIRLLEEHASLVLQDLSHALDADVRFGVLNDLEVRYIEKPHGRCPVTTYSQGATLPAHATAMGKALLAFSAPALVDLLLRRGLTAFTPFTLTAPDRFRRALAIVRLRRLAVAHRELKINRSALAVPVFSPGGPVLGAIEVGVDNPGADSPDVEPALIVAGRSLTRELSITSNLEGRDAGRPRPGSAL
jgi:DNA-binding IclR family transcriptional regulator